MSEMMSRKARTSDLPDPKPSGDGDLKVFYVTFGGLLIGYYQEVHALSREIVGVWMNKKSKIGCWCSVVTERPRNMKPLQEMPERMYYDDPGHIH